MMAVAHARPGDVQTFNCEQAVRRLWDYLDGELNALDVAAVDAHLVQCERCPAHFTFERRFLDAVRDARAAIYTPDTATTASLRVRVVSMLAAAGELRHLGALE